MTSTMRQGQLSAQKLITMKFLIDRWKTADQDATNTLTISTNGTLTCSTVVAIPAVLDEIMAGTGNNITVQL